MDFAAIRASLIVLASAAAEKTGATQATGTGGGIDENLLQFLFVILVVAGIALAALFYAGNVLSVPWARALSNTDRQAIVNAGMITGVALIVGGYTVAEPLRREAALVRQNAESTHRGGILYSTYCISCHGITGGGGPVPTDLSGGAAAYAPPVANRADFRPEAILERDKQAEYIRRMIARGGKGNGKSAVMSAWALEEGGPLNTQDVQNLTDFVQFGNFAEVRGHMTPQQIVSAEATVVASGGAPDPGAPPGKILFLSKGCVACHVIQGIPGGGAVGPNLSKKGADPLIAGVLETNKENMMKWLANPQAINPGTAMPNLGLTPDETSKLSDYLLTLK